MVPPGYPLGNTSGITKSSTQRPWLAQGVCHSQARQITRHLRHSTGISSARVPYSRCLSGLWPSSTGTQAPGPAGTALTTGPAISNNCCRVPLDSARTQVINSDSSRAPASASVTQHGRAHSQLLHPSHHIVARYSARLCSRTMLWLGKRA